MKVRYLSDDDKYWAEIVNFGHKYVHVPDHYVRQYDLLLMGGIWAQIDIRHEYDDEARGKRSPFWIDDIKPIQLGVVRSRRATVRAGGRLMPTNGSIC